MVLLVALVSSLPIFVALFIGPPLSAFNTQPGSSCPLSIGLGLTPVRHAGSGDNFPERMSDSLMHQAASVNLMYR